MTAFGFDLRQAWRSLRHTPGFTAVAVLTLGLGIGGNVAIFSVVRHVLLQPLPYPEPERLVVIWENDRLRGTTREGTSGPDFRDFEQRLRSFERLAARQRSNLTLASREGEAVRLPASLVTPGYFAMLGVEPLLGRSFEEADTRAGSAPVAVLGERLWRSRFGADPGVLGLSLPLDGRATTVVGVVPETARLPFSDEALFAPLAESPRLGFRGVHSLLALGRIRASVSHEQAQQDISRVMAELEKEYPEDNQGRGAVLVPFQEQLTGDVRPALLVLLAAVGVVLLVACANVANLLLARGLGRARELGLRTALGAGPWRLARLVLTESLMLALLGGALGIGLAWAGVRALVAAAPEQLPRIEAIEVDITALLVALGLSLATGLVFGLLPALRGALSRPLDALRDGGRTTGSGRARNALVVAEVALSVALVVAAGLLIRSLAALSQVEPGFRSEGLLLAELDLSGPAYPFPEGWPVHDWPQLDRFVGELQPRLEALPGVSGVAFSHMGPIDPGWTTRVTVVGRPAPPPGEQDEASFRQVGPGYFATTGIPLLRGRAFDRFDSSDAALVAIVNEAFVQRHFGAAPPLDQSIDVFGAPRRVVGVARDVRFAGLESQAQPAIYLPLDQNPQGNLVVALRVEGEPMRLAPDLRAQVAAVDPTLAVYDVRAADAALRGSLAERRFSASLLLLFAGVALSLAMVGVYGVIAYSVARRTREIGVRVALGAAPAGLVWMVLLRGLALVAAALVIGFGLAAMAGRLLQGLLFGVEAGDPLTFAVVAVLLAIAAVVASLVPAWRATRVDPLEALRAE
jgi:predicted permease